MINFYLKQTGILPGISFDRASGKLEINGQSCPTNADVFYYPVLKWLDDYIAYPCETTILTCFLSYFNTMSAKAILMILKKLEELSKSGKDVKIRWFHYEDDIDLMEAGLDFEMIVDVDFEIVSVDVKEQE